MPAAGQRIPSPYVPPPFQGQSPALQSPVHWPNLSGINSARRHSEGDKFKPQFGAGVPYAHRPNLPYSEGGPTPSQHQRSMTIVGPNNQRPGTSYRATPSEGPMTPQTYMPRLPFQ
jgi:hypothetical protein